VKNVQEKVDKKEKPKVKETSKKILNTDKVQKDINYILKKSPVYFKFDSDKLTSKGIKTLNKILKILKKENAKFELMIEGHSNAIGNETYNKKLSQKRAESVKKYLLKHYKNLKITAKGYGSKKPCTKNPKDKKNRRVEIIITKGHI
jgi:OOP family OmpA-OmpF porin